MTRSFKHVVIIILVLVVALGTLPGLAAAHRSVYFLGDAAHSEITRLLAEHGLLGLAALVMLAFVGWNNLRRARPTRYKAFVSSVLAFAAFFMAVNATRIALPCVAFAISFAQFESRRKGRRWLALEHGEPR